MKKVIAAEIKRLLEFDSVQEMYTYIGKLRAKGVAHQCLDHMQMPDGKVRLIIATAYNSSPLFGDYWEEQE